MSWVPDVCIYHDPCLDGFTAAWVVKRKWPDVQLCPTNYGLKPPLDGVVGKRVLIADFSYSAEVLRQLADGAHSVVVLDHHKTAAADLADISCGAQDGPFTSEQAETLMRVSAHLDTSRLAAHFDMNKSGARLAWEFCHGEAAPPPIVEYVEDRDLWRFALTASAGFSLLLRSYPATLETWDAMAAKPTSEVLAEAAAIERFYNKQVREIADTATRVKFDDYEGVPVVYAPYGFVSDVANVLLLRNPDAPFVVAVVNAFGGKTCSLRSDDGRIDVSAVAKKYGGGGHRNAAGFRVSGV